MIDFQIQTTASDGKFSPRDCVRMAKENGVTSLAITDHDTIGGVDEAKAAGVEFGMEVIPGIEMSCNHGGHGIHILGLGINHKHPILGELLSELQREREHRAKLMVEKLQSFGFAVDYKEVRQRAAGVVARPHIAEAVMENPANAGKLAMEGIKTRKDFFSSYIANNAKAYVHHVPLEARRAISVIHQAGGIAIWSHPTIPTEKYNILRSAGSDFHDTYIDPEKPEDGAAAIGGYKTYGYSTEGIRESILSAIDRRRAAVAGLKQTC